MTIKRITTITNIDRNIIYRRETELRPGTRFPSRIRINNVDFTYARYERGSITIQDPDTVRLRTNDGSTDINVREEHINGAQGDKIGSTEYLEFLTVPPALPLPQKLLLWGDLAKTVMTLGILGRDYKVRSELKWVPTLPPQSRR